MTQKAVERNAFKAVTQANREVHNVIHSEGGEHRNSKQHRWYRHIIIDV